MTNADEYIQKFKELEAIVKETFGLNDWDSITNFLSKRDEYRPFREEIKYCQEVRNLLQHKQKIGNEYPIQPSREMIAFLDRTINSLKNRKRCNEIMVPASRIFSRKITDALYDAVLQMRESSLGHIPVLYENGFVAGVFTSFSFFNLMVDQKGAAIPKMLTFENAKEYIAFDYHKTETYRFVSGSLFVDELKEIFESTYSGGKRLSMVFVTSNGKKDGKLLGIISPWDVLGKENER
ncbi:MAG: CBS domain-containing protein [Oscillospiraceae bacterium]|nr:CBS domain-containing protein [Oscillospiraceae bacterium]